ncbi:MAG: hypothetical protein KC475_09445, partial [Cyanobacteria bacterium HKST-UBA03]|nr:hypothetical protein [Cyanobacteria bacterium HKST-UBA03]
MNKPVKVKLKKKAGEASDEGAAEPGNAPGSQGGGSGSGGVSGHEETAVGFDFIKYRLAWYGISALLIVPGLVMMVLSMMTYDTHTPLKLGIDFTGGTMLEYAFEKELTQSDLPAIQASLNQLGLGDSVIQIQHPKEHMTVNTATVSTELQTDPHATTEEAEAVDVNGLPVMPKADKASDDRSITQVIEDLNKDGKAENLKNAAFDVSTLVSIRTRDLSTEQTVTLQKSLTDQFGRFALLQKNRVGPVLAKEILIKGSLALLLAYALIVVYLT